MVNEFFADRPYDGTKVTMFDWTYDQLGSPADAADRVAKVLSNLQFDTVETICVHSDTRDAPVIMAEVRHRLIDDGHEVGCSAGDAFPPGRTEAELAYPKMTLPSPATKSAVADAASG